jgi:signal transduction histidine kinase
MKARTYSPGVGVASRATYPMRGLWADRDVSALPKLPPIAVDATIVAVLVVAGLIQQLGAPHPEHEIPGGADPFIHGAVIVAAILPLLWRRRFPFLTVVIIGAVMGAAGSVGPLLTYDPSPASAFGLMFATFNATSLGGRAIGWCALAAAWVAVTLILRPWVTPIAAWFPNYPYYLVAFLAGRMQRQRRDLARILEIRIVDETAHRERLQQLALQEARGSLARDLHDVVVTALRVASDHARDALRRLIPPTANAGHSLRATEEAGRTALAELRLLLGVLRRGDRVGQGLVDRRGPAELQRLAREAASSEAEALGRVDGVGRIQSISRWLSRRGWPTDLALVVVLITGAMLEFQIWEEILGPAIPPEVFSTAAHVWAVAWILLLLLRRHAPVLTGLAMAVMAFLQTFPFGYWTPVSDIAALQIAVYTIGSLKPKRPYAWAVAVAGAIGLVSIPPPPVHLGVVGFLVIMAVTLGGAAYVGTVVGERRRLNEELDQRLVTLAEERSTELELALREERLALAREMHDLVAHSLTLMVVQAGAARTVASTDPAAARQAIQAVIGTGRQAADELERLLDLLAAGAVHAPQPGGSRDVDELVRRARQSGLDVEFVRTGNFAPPTGSSLELSVFRILQEALTNAHKHAPGACVRVQMTFDTSALVLRVENDESPAQAQDIVSLGAGRGLLGMQERVAMFGGRFEAGPAPGGGFVVDALLPAGGVTA